MWSIKKPKSLSKDQKGKVSPTIQTNQTPEKMCQIIYHSKIMSAQLKPEFEVPEVNAYELIKDYNPVLIPKNTTPSKSLNKYTNLPNNMNYSSWGIVKFKDDQLIIIDKVDKIVKDVKNRHHYSTLHHFKCNLIQNWDKT